MPSAPNVLRWDGKPGHYEVYYVTLTDPASGIGAWIRYTMVAPLERSGEPPSASLWFLTMDPNGGVLGRKAMFPADALRAASDPFELRIGEAVLTDSGMEGSFEDVAWDLRWVPGRSYETVHPLLRRVASTILVLPHADVAIEGTISFGGRTVQLDDQETAGLRVVGMYGSLRRFDRQDIHHLDGSRHDAGCDDAGHGSACFVGTVERGQ